MSFNGNEMFVYGFVKVQWKEMFPSMISKASTMEVVFNGDGNNRDGAVQLVSFFFLFLSSFFPFRPRKRTDRY